MKKHYKRVLTIAGSDPSGGAGIQADLKTFSALGAYGCSVITALVAQNTRGVQSVYRIEPDFVAAQLDSVFSDVRIDTTKIGMLAETDIVEAVAERLARYQIDNVVLDTVMLAKSGDPLLSASAVEGMLTLSSHGIGSGLVMSRRTSPAATCAAVSKCLPGLWVSDIAMLGIPSR